jgi:hypothetical protein
MDLLKGDALNLDIQEELRRLREENARLVEVLTRHGIPWEESIQSVSIPTASKSASSIFSPDDKITLFRRLFRGREDTYPQRWESKTNAIIYRPFLSRRS